MLAVSAAQVVGLGLARLVDQRSAAALRLVLGAGRRHLLRQTVAEALVPAAGGFLIACVAVPWLQAMAGRWIPPEVLRGRHLNADLGVIAVGAGLSMTVLIVLAAAQYFAVPWRSAGHVVRKTSGWAVGSRGRGQSFLLIAQTAVAVSLVYLSALTVQSFVSLLRTDLGFKQDNLLVFQFPWGRRSLAELRGEGHRVQASLDWTRSVAGVSSAVVTSSLPLGGMRMHLFVRHPDGSERQVALEPIWPGYFGVMGIPLLEGRDFDEGDLPGSPLRVVVNQSLAAEIGEGRSLIGETVPVGGLPHEVVGVVGDVRTIRPDQPAPLQAYVSSVQRRAPAVALIVRTRPGEEDTVRAAVSAVFTRTWGRGPATAETFADRIDRLLAPFRARGLFLVVLAATALALTAAGLAASLADQVRAQRGELAVRMALGATTEGLRRAVVRKAVSVTGAGIVLGVAAGAAVTRIVSNVLHGVAPLEPVVVLAVAGAFVSSAVLAGAYAARVACAFEPADSLKAM